MHVYYLGFVQENTSHSMSSGYKGHNIATGAYRTVGRAEGAELRAATAKVRSGRGRCQPEVWLLRACWEAFSLISVQHLAVATSAE